jgi:mannose-6-phosphate isomerase-like protein (cupin superfamily)
MNTINAYIESGLLELYVLGLCSEAEAATIKQLALQHPEIETELQKIEAALQLYAESQAATPSAEARAMLIATIDYTTRLQNGEPVTTPPLLHSGSAIADFEPWLSRTDMIRPEDNDLIFLKLIGANEKATTAILWLDKGAPPETHTDEHERFLILEGTCDIVVNGKSNLLKAGDYFEIPLHADHHVMVTSDCACKAILQRVAA